MYEDRTQAAIKEEILSQLRETVDIREGSYTDDMARGVAYMMSAWYERWNRMIPIAFVDETSGIYLDKRAAEYGIYRKEGTKAVAAVTVSGQIGAVVPEGGVFATPGGLRFLAEEAVTLEGETAEVEVRAEEPGSAWNVPEGAISVVGSSMRGIRSVYGGAAEGGTDPEDDKSLFARLVARRTRPATSGNVYHYEEWALETPGVGAARVFPLWQGAGTVRVVIVDAEYAPPAEDIVRACNEHIQQMRPIGASVTVDGAAALPVTVAARVILDGSAQPVDVQKAFKDALTDYVGSVVFKSDVLRYNRIGMRLLELEGVVDYEMLTVNGGTADISIADDQAPVLTEVTVTC